MTSSASSECHKRDSRRGSSDEDDRLRVASSDPSWKVPFFSPSALRSILLRDICQRRIGEKNDEDGEERLEGELATKLVGKVERGLK